MRWPAASTFLRDISALLDSLASPSVHGAEMCIPSSKNSARMPYFFKMCEDLLGVARVGPVIEGEGDGFGGELIAEDLAIGRAARCFGRFGETLSPHSARILSRREKGAEVGHVGCPTSRVWRDAPRVANWEKMRADFFADR